MVSGGIAAARYLPGFFQEVARRYGDIACIPAGPARVFILSSPEHAQDLLVDQDDLFEKGRGERRFTRRLLGKGVPRGAAVPGRPSAWVFRRDR